MIEHSFIEEVLLCLQQINLLSHLKIQTLHLVTAATSSNLLLIGYCFSALIIKRASYLMPFLFAETITKLEVFNSTGNVFFFVQLSFVACVIYWVGKRLNFNHKALFCYAIIALFELFMAADAYIYPETVTYVYESYEFIIVAIHLAVIASTINIRKLRLYSRRFFSFISSVFRDSYTIRYICYNLKQISSTKKL